jgi:signal transduction histidine kinase
VLWDRFLRRLSYKWVIRGVVLVLLAVNVGWAARQHPAQTIPLELFATLSLLALPRFPLSVLAIQIANLAAADLAYGFSNPFPLWFALCAVAAIKPRRVSLWGAVAALAGVLASREVLNPAQTIAGVLSIAVAWVLGDTLRSRRAWLREETNEKLRRAASDEQARIARDLHDAIAHSVSVMVVQAAAANDVFEAQPEKARDALRSIEATGRSALTELRRLLGVVQGSAEDAFAPQPRLGSIDELVSRVRTAGLPVVLHVDGDLGDLPTGLDLSAYRIVQEALTNTLKHAGASRAEVDVRRTPTDLELEIVDDGVGTRNGDAAGSGRGLIGMQARASLVGGEVEARPLPGRGFRVRARLPL